MAGAARDKIKDVLTPPATKAPPWKKTRVGCFMTLRTFWSTPAPATHSHAQSVTMQKRSGRAQWGVKEFPFLTPRLGPTFDGLSPHLEKNHYSWNFLVMKAIHIYIYFQTLTGYYVSWEKNSRSDAQRVIRDVIIWSFWGCLKSKLRTTEHISF